MKQILSNVVKKSKNKMAENVLKAAGKNTKYKALEAGKKLPSEVSNESGDEKSEMASSDNESVASTINPNDTYYDSDRGGSETDSLTGSEWDTSSVSSSNSQFETKKERKLKNRKRKNLAEEVANGEIQYDIFAENPSIKHSFYVLVRIFEAKELASDDIDPVVKVNLDKKQRKTNILKETNNPKFNQTFTFKVNANLEELSSKNVDFSLYCSKKIFKDSAIGAFRMNLGLVYRQKDHLLPQKWLSLSSPLLNEDDAEGSDVRGFLKVSICLYHENQSPPSLIGKPTGEPDEILQCAQNLNYNLRLRIFKLSQVADFIRFQSNAKQPNQLMIEIKVGKMIIYTDCVVANDDTLCFGEEICIPITWPSVVNDIRFRVIQKRNKFRKRVLLTSKLSLNSICRCGKKGFLPTFGPSFVPFYGPDKINGTLTLSDIKAISQGAIEGTIFCGRLFIDIATFETFLKAPTKNAIPTIVCSSSASNENCSPFVLSASFFGANQIHPDFKEKNVHFTVSIGHYGNDAYNDLPNNSNSTLPVLPFYDSIQYYSMPWGNQKPLCEVECMFEDVEFRAAESNILFQISEFLLESKCELEMMMRSNPNQITIADKTLDCFFEATEAFNSLADFNTESNRKRYGDRLTELDYCLQNARFAALQIIANDFNTFKKDKNDVDDMGERCLNLIISVSAKLKKLSVDTQISIPDVLITMYASEKSVGFKRIPISELIYVSNNRASGNGKYIGKITPIHLQRINQERSNYKEDDIPAILLLKLFFSKVSKKKSFSKIVLPGQIRYYAEYFENQTRKMFNKEWQQAKTNPFATTDVTGKIAIYENSISPPPGWKFKDDWKVKRCHDMWVGADAGHNKFEDTVYEKYRKNGKKWEFNGFSDFDGNSLDPELIAKAPEGWKYDENWKVDKNVLGDPKGFLYSMKEDFWTNQNSLDVTEKFTHVFKRRKLIRMRTLKADTKRLDLDHLISFKEKLGETGWEYSKKFGEPIHVLAQSSDRFRRRRYVREMVREEKKDNQKSNIISNTDCVSNMVARIYEVHDTCSMFQLRVYVLWGRELLDNTSKIKRVFVRVTFLNKSQESIYIGNCVNPVWNEMILFDRVLVPGSVNSMVNHPPLVFVEVIGEAHSEVEIFLGRFTLKPNFSISNQKKNTELCWSPLILPRNKSYGSLLIGSDMLLINKETQKIDIDDPVAKKENAGRYEIPVEIMPRFVKYNIQILCWGVRNLSKHKLLAVKKPFVEISIGDLLEVTESIEDLKNNPNFSKNLVYFKNVSLPERLYFSSPIILTLRDKRIFGSKPIIGTSLVQNFDRFEIKTNAIQKPVPFSRWIDYDSLMSIEIKAYEEEIFKMNLDEENADSYFTKYRIDWWSKYYFSLGEKDKARGYSESELEPLAIYGQSLEDSDEFRGFCDFLQTFKFGKVKKSNGYSRNVDIKGELKGRLIITKSEEQKDIVDIIPGIEFEKPELCIVRVYVVRAHSLVTTRGHKTCDPYISLRCANFKKISLKKEYVPDTLDPIFGQVIETEIWIPQQKDIEITIMDNRRFSFDEEIGSTTIDLENRLLSKFRATVGLPKKFNVYGPNIWRDQYTPMEILKKYLEKMNLPPPELISDKEGNIGMKILEWTFYLKEEDVIAKKNQFSGRPHQRLALLILNKIGLVPEHVETRPLYNSINKSMECGKVEIFVDIFPKTFGSIPPQINISKRIPDKFQLRISVFETRYVINPKKVAGKDSCDMYVKCLLNGADKAVSTDVHYNCSDGRGSFMWRFVFDVNFSFWEEKLYQYKNKRFFRKKTETTSDPFITLEICDNKKFKKDSLIGRYTLDLLNIEKGVMELTDFYDEEDIRQERHAKANKKRCLSTCCCGICSCKKNKNMGRRAPRYFESTSSSPPVSIFEKQNIRGWWPCISSSLTPQQKNDKLMYRKKFDSDSDNGYDNFKDENVTDEAKYVTGYVELDISVVNTDEAKENPVGKGRKKPNHSPVLPERKRDRCDSFFLTARAKKYCCRFVSKRCMWSICCCLIIFLLIAGLIQFIFKLPEIIINKV
uniref:C2 domain-containing protein n=1 Tax=Rhabditophanes sp. KR3021 TaxID=114890 RepID=A0AC35UI59_9BILA